MLWIKLTSILPPERTQTTFLPSTSSLPPSTAARGVAPAGSTICLQRSISKRIALEISLSETVTTPSTYWLMISTVISPGDFTAMPSAMVEAVSVVISFFSRKLRAMALAPSAWTP